MYLLDKNGSNNIVNKLTIINILKKKKIYVIHLKYRNIVIIILLYIIYFVIKKQHGQAMLIA